MDFRIEQHFPATPTEVVAALCDPSYLALMGELRDISAPRVRSQRRDGPRLWQVLEFKFRGRLPAAVTKVVDPSRLSWLEHDEIDFDRCECRFEMVPEHYRKFFTCAGTWSVVPAGAGSRRIITGRLKVKSPVPFVGGKVEKAIVSGLEERLADEPRVFERWRSAG